MFKNFPPLFPNLNFVPAAILFFFCTYHGRRIRFDAFIIRRVSYRRRSIQRIIFNFLYISAINTTFLPFSPIFSSLSPSPFFLYLSVIPKTDSFQWKKIGKESPQRYEGQGSRRIRGQEFFRRELRRWRKFGHANGKSFGWDRGIIGSTGWSEAADNYTDIDGSMMGRRGSRISKGRPCYFLTPFPFPFSFFSRPPCPPLGGGFPPCRKTANYLSVPHPRCALVESSFR